MSLPLSEIPLGAMRFNSDSQRLEYWNGSAWFQIHSFSSNLDGGARGVMIGGHSHPSYYNTIDFVTIPIQGNATDFGDLTVARAEVARASNAVRSVFVSGGTPSPKVNTIDFVTIASLGDALDFGDLTATLSFLGGASNSIKGIFAGGNTPTKVSTIQSIEIATTGNAVAFGDNKVTNPVTSRGSCSDSHGGL